MSTAVLFYEKLEEWLADPQLSGRPKVDKPPADGTTALGDVMCMASLALDFLEKLPWCVQSASLHHDCCFILHSSLQYRFVSLSSSAFAGAPATH